jgi:hypothetical protein
LNKQNIENFKEEKAIADDLNKNEVKLDENSNRFILN